MNRHLIRTEPLARPLLVCLAAAFACVFAYNTADPDLWGHVRYGADTLARGRIFETDPYSYTSGGFPWINHELVCEFTLGFIEPRLGAVGLLTWKCLIGAVTIGALVWTHRRGEFAPTTVVLLATLLALNLWPGWTLRPQLFTYAFLSLLALLLTEHDRGRRHVLWFAPPLVVAWTNAHGGFVAGLGILATHLAFAAVGEIRRREAGWFSRTTELAAVGICSAVATLVNPYGVGLVAWIRDSLTWPRPEIMEWWPVSLFNTDYFPFKVLVVVAALALGFSRRPRLWNRITILALAAVQALMHRRHIPLVAILAAYWLPEHVDDLVERFRAWATDRAKLPEPDAGSVRIHRAALVALLALFAALSFVQFRAIEVDRATYPVTAFEFIERNQLDGRMVTEFNWGQYCLYAFWPRILVSVDGRFDTSYSRETLDINLDFTMGDHPRYRNRSPATGPFDADRALDAGRPNLALVDRQRTDCVRAIERRPDWVLLYQDAVAQVWGLRSVYDDPASSKFLPFTARSISNAPQSGWVAYPALPIAEKADNRPARASH